jgi:hypothetical protein
MFRLIIFPLFFLYSAFIPAYGEEKYIANPPKGWECIHDASQLPQKIKVIYVGKGTANNPFAPSINVACETTSMLIGEYVSLAKAYHEGERGTRCTALGKMNTESGAAELLQIDRPSQWGPVRFVQAMLIREGEAYVVTATCLKEDFSALSSQVFKAIQSLTLPEKTLQTN